MSNPVIKKAKQGLKDFLTGWKQLDHQKMYDACQYTWSKGKTVEHLKTLFPIALDSYETKKLTEVTKVVYDAIVKITHEETERVVRIRLICEEGAYIPSVDGDFGVNPNSIRPV